MLIEGFVVSLLMYCLPILYTSLYSRDKKEMRKIFKDAEKLGLDNIDNFDTLVSKHPEHPGAKTVF